MLPKFMLAISLLPNCHEVLKSTLFNTQEVGLKYISRDFPKLHFRTRTATSRVAWQLHIIFENLMES